VTQNRIGLLGSSSKQGSLIKKGMMYQPQNILDSNAYFGEVLKNQGFAA